MKTQLELKPIPTWQRVASVRRDNKWFYTTRLNGCQYWVVQNNYNDNWYFENTYGDKVGNFRSDNEARYQALEFSKTHKPIR